MMLNFECYGASTTGSFRSVNQDALCIDVMPNNMLMFGYVYVHVYVCAVYVYTV